MQAANKTTIPAYIAGILKQYEGIAVEINHMETGSDQYGLYRSPGRNKKDFTDGSYEVTEHFQFYARQSAISVNERKETDEWLEDLTYWVDDYPFLYDFPELDQRREVTDLSITGAPYVADSESGDVLYQMAVSITYIREREGL